ncbi:MAG: hypothetical protein FJZ01_07010 [Candidatus Sericytochromatia bacterium]|nr:hypothetical protein [Candidatus Tanganyikabacteria bacterium]
MGARLGTIGCLGAALLAACGIFDPTPRTGAVTGPDGAPLAGVTVSTGDASAVTGADGRWALATRTRKATFRKPGFSPLAATLPAGATVLEPSAVPVQAVFDDRWAGPAQDGIRTWLGSQGVAVRVLASGDLPEAEVIVLAAPSFYSQKARDETLRAVRAGATLLLAGEWGGASRVEFQALDALAGSAGIRFAGSLTRDPSAGLLVDWLTPEFIVSLPQASESARFAAAGVLSAIPPAFVLARSGEASYRITTWQRGPQVLAAYGPLGAGKVVAVSDASWLGDDRTLDPARPNWEVAGNAALALALVRF